MVLILDKDPPESPKRGLQKNEACHLGEEGVLGDEGTKMKAILSQNKHVCDNSDRFLLNRKRRASDGVCMFPILGEDHTP